MPEKRKCVMDIQAGDGYEHRPGIKNRVLKCMRKYEFLSCQYRDRIRNSDVTSENKTILEEKLKESEVKYAYYFKIYHENQ